MTSASSFVVLVGAPVPKMLVVALALVTVALPNPSAPLPEFTLAIARVDGYLVPFASHENDRWVRAWPEADEAVEGTPTIDEVPSVWQRRRQRVPRAWRLWPLSGTGPVRTRVLGVATVEAHCGAQIALKTDLRARKGDLHLKLGIAVDSTTVRIDAIDRVPSSDPRWSAVERAVRTQFDWAEAVEAAKSEKAIPADEPVPAARITALFRQRRSSGSPFYFTAERTYRGPVSPQDAGCRQRTVVTGWLLPRAAGDLAAVAVEAFLTDCDGKEVRTARPLGALRVSSRLFWVLQDHGYEDETYVVAEIGRAGVTRRISVNGGGC